MNGLDEQETWRDVGLLLGGTTANPVMQHVTTACHHCLEPGCMTACPVNAYEKDPVTGIVKHLDDQCFGCQYCILACPYDVPKYHPDKGIVRKCDMCSDRLADGEAPACVQSCPHEAIAIKVVDPDNPEIELGANEVGAMLIKGACLSSIANGQMNWMKSGWKRVTSSWPMRASRNWSFRPAQAWSNSI